MKTAEFFLLRHNMTHKKLKMFILELKYKPEDINFMDKVGEEDQITVIDIGGIWDILVATPEI